MAKAKANPLAATEQEELFLKALEAAGFARDEAVRRLAALRAKFPLGEIPLAILSETVKDLIQPALLDTIVKGGLTALFKTLNEGKGPVMFDPTAHA